MMNRFSVAAAVIVLASPSPLLAQSVFDGTWKTDISSAQLPKKPDIYMLKGGTYSCKSCVPPYSVKADGTDQAVSGHPYFDTVSVQVVDDHTVHEIDKLKGKTTQDVTVTVAPDGQSLTFDGMNSVGTTPVTYKGSSERVGKEHPKGHAISGKWRITSYSGVSDAGLTQTYKVSGGSITMSTPTGASYTAKLDGTDAPNKGDPGIDTVSVKLAGKNTLVETDKLNGKVVGVQTSTVAADGKSMTVKYKDALRGTTSTFTANKI
jgi:hypothetical protein